MTRSLLSTLCYLLCLALRLPAQEKFIHTKEGGIIMERKGVIDNCLRSLRKNRSDSVALAICNCQVDRLNRHFPAKQYKKYTKNSIINITAMMDEDTLFKQQMQDCYTHSGKTVLLQAEGFREEFISNCKKSLQASTEKKLDPDRLNNFCNCQLELVKSRKLTDAEVKALNDPNSLLLYEVMGSCGDPFEEEKDAVRQWTKESAQDISGPSGDTISILTIDGMAYLRIRIGGLTKVWLFDTGASDLLINSEMEADLKNEKVFTASNYLGTGEYEMANGMIDTCRKYRVNNIRIGQFTLNNMVVAVTDKGKKIIAGKALLNKFSDWMLDNRASVLILRK
jgi:hypothetical protein